MEEFSIPLGSEASHLAMRPLLGALENESISMTILGKASPKQKSHLPEKEGGIRFSMEPSGFEPLTPCMPCRCSTS